MTNKTLKDVLLFGGLAVFFILIAAAKSYGHELKPEVKKALVDASECFSTTSSVRPGREYGRRSECKNLLWDLKKALRGSEKGTQERKCRDEASSWVGYFSPHTGTPDLTMRVRRFRYPKTCIYLLKTVKGEPK